jgi:chromosomal replication initiation ATPase DnaA
LPQLLISPSNRALVASLLNWRGWSTPVALLIGPPRSGKSLLANHVAHQSGLVRIIDPVEEVDETELFHVWTAALADRAPLLVTAEPNWQPRLPDLVTRVAAAQDFICPDPDPELLAVLLERRLADHHLSLAADVAGYVSQRMERSFAALDAVVDTLTKSALSDGRPLSLPVVRATLREVQLLLANDDANIAAA